MNRVRATLSANPLLVDALIALGLTAYTLFAVAAGQPGPRTAGALILTLLVLQCVPLVLRRRFPVAVLLVIVGAATAQLALLQEASSLYAGVGMLIALYTVGERLERRASFGLTVLASVVVAAGMFRLAGFQVGLQPVIQTVFFLGAAWFVGYASRFRRLYTQALEEQTRLLEREREERARIAVFEERERIARELHDAVAHHVSVVVIQAGGALRALEKRPTEARAALEAIRVTGRQALIDMRRMLGVLGEGSTQEPLPGLDGLSDLLEQVRWLWRAAGDPWTRLWSCRHIGSSRRLSRTR
jgi:signal transduction histidine kinase